jgi:hypothetical protein
VPQEDPELIGQVVEVVRLVDAACAVGIVLFSIFTTIWI